MWFDLDATGTSIHIQKPQLNTYHVVEVPGVVKNGSAVIEALGGYGRIAESFRRPTVKPLILRLHYKDPYSKFLGAQTYRSLGLVLRLRRHKTTGRRQVRIEGIANQTFRFTSLADYYLAPEPALRMPLDVVSYVDRLRHTAYADIYGGVRSTSKSKTPTTANIEFDMIPEPATVPEPDTPMQPSSPDSDQDSEPVSVSPRENPPRENPPRENPPRGDSSRGDSDEDPAWTDMLTGTFRTEELPPPLYTRQSQPFNYRYSVNVFSALSKYFLLPNRELVDTPFVIPENIPEAEGDTRISGGEIHALGIVPKGMGSVCNAVARIADLRLPTYEDVPRTAIAVSIGSGPLLDELKVLFEQRPLWQRNSLFAHLSKHATIWRLKPVLAHTCFLFMDGPWRGCLCRLGFDPRKDPNTRNYQTIDFRDTFFRSVKYRTQKARKNRSNDGGTDWQFLVAPNKPSCLYQLCDIQDTKVQRLLQITKPLEEFDNNTGWITADTITRIRDLLSVRSQQLRSQTKE
ncbi:putative RNA polymerase III transcription factor subunit [Gregarina niphandrodes]|uniref:RNA polymerase III transcription factor subunit n=1 Tax=Gregarina niphandrodes TaxID=110365 RepID=A0A023B056_GRENI|nr:putative RNA polymerase III transcription factor subunit [Gregarina niphandrodes]EZG43955.1 putative RNA polymerase III transcription factor subunit [Gregarina niphandrodes]|eukprot:XP_011132886.1 putative RNA polymerase III transcription factor subunit [Gregarina niphandrodes]